MINKKRIVVMGVIIVLILLSGLYVITRDGFNGNRIKNPDEYILEIYRMNGQDEHILNLESGDTLKVNFKTDGGSLKLRITGPDNLLIYEGNGQDSNEFLINITDNGQYRITVDSFLGKGNIHVVKE